MLFYRCHGRYPCTASLACKVLKNITFIF